MAFWHARWCWHSDHSVIITISCIRCMCHFSHKTKCLPTFPHYGVNLISEIWPLVSSLSKSIAQVCPFYTTMRQVSLSLNLGLPGKHKSVETSSFSRMYLVSYQYTHVWSIKILNWTWIFCKPHHLLFVKVRRPRSWVMTMPITTLFSKILCTTNLSWCCHHLMSMCHGWEKLHFMNIQAYTLICLGTCPCWLSNIHVCMVILLCLALS